MRNITLEKEKSEPSGRFSSLIQAANLVKTGWGEGEEYSNRGLKTFLSLQRFFHFNRPRKTPDLSGMKWTLRAQMHSETYQAR